MPWKVLIIDDHDIVRWGLSQLFGRETDFDVCGTTGEARAALELIESHTPSLVTTDLSLPGRNGLDLIKQVSTLCPDLFILVVSMYAAQIYARRALTAGAHGYVSKSEPHEEIVRAARTVVAGETYVSGNVSIEHYDRSHADEEFLECLTDRELEVLVLLGQGYAPRDIAEKLSLSTSTIEVYRQGLKNKLDVDTATLLRRYAVQWCHQHVHTPNAVILSHE